MFAETRNESVGTNFNPESLLRGEAPSRGRDIGDRLAFASARVVDDGDIRCLGGALHLVENRFLPAQKIQRLNDIGIGHAFGFDLHRDTLVLRQFKFRSGLNGGGELQRLAAAELDFLDVRVAEHIELLFIHGFLVRVRDQLALGFVENFLLILAQHHLPRGFTRAEARQIRLPLKIFRRVINGFIDLLNIDFEADQLFAWRQIFYGNIHKENLSVTRLIRSAAISTLGITLSSESATILKQARSVKFWRIDSQATEGSISCGCHSHRPSIPPAITSV